MEFLVKFFRNSRPIFRLTLIGISSSVYATPAQTVVELNRLIAAQETALADYRDERRLTFAEKLAVRKNVAEAIVAIDDSGMLVDPTKGRYTVERVARELAAGIFARELNLPLITDPRLIPEQLNRTD